MHPIIALFQPENYQEASGHFTESGLDKDNIHWSEGIIGHALGLKPSVSFANNEFGWPRFIEFHTIGFNLGYAACLNMGIAMRWDRFWIIEDDCRFLRPPSDEMNRCEFLLENHQLDVLLAGYSGLSLRRIEKTIAPGLVRCPGLYCTHLILWTWEAAIKARALLYPCVLALDILFARDLYPRLNHGALHPVLAIQKGRPQLADIHP